MSLLLDLPRVIKLPLLSVWFDPRDLGKLDSSLCSLPSRKLFLRSISDPFFCFPDDLSLFCGGFVTWLNERKCRVNSLRVRGVDDLSSIQKYISTVNPNISTVEIHQELFDTPFHAQIYGLKNLTIACNVLLYNCFANVVRILLDHNSDLETFHLGYYKGHNPYQTHHKLTDYENSDSDCGDSSASDGGNLDSDDENDSNSNDSTSDGSSSYIYNESEDWDYSDWDLESDISIASVEYNKKFTKPLSLRYAKDKDCEYDMMQLNTAQIATALSSDLTESNKLLKLTSFVCTHKDIGDGYLVAIANVAPNLREIDVSGCVLITKIGFMELFPKYPLLQSFHARNCPNIDSDVINSLADSCKSLEHFSYTRGRGYNHTSTAVYYLIHTCHNLKSFIVNGYDLMNRLEYNTKYMVRPREGKVSCCYIESVEKFGVHYTEVSFDISNDNNSIPNDMIKYVISKCPNIEIATSFVCHYYSKQKSY